MHPTDGTARAAIERWSSIAWGLIAVGVVLRLWAFLTNYSLFVDEAALARNILDRSWTELLRPLDFAQVAPLGFLFSEKAVVTVLGSSEQALRLVPLLCGVASVGLCWAVARRVLAPVPALAALGLLSLNIALIEFAARVKPYSCDVAAGLLVILLATRVLEPQTSRRSALWMGAAGATTVLFSFTVAFVLGAAVMAVLVASFKTDSWRRQALWLVSAIWILGGLGAIVLGRLLISPTDAAYMKFFWSPGFMPLPPKTIEEALWVFIRLLKIFRWTGNYQAAVGWVGLMAIGVWSLGRRPRREAGIMLTAPLLLLVIAAAVREYPFTLGRVDLFLLPMLLMLVAEGAEQWRRAVTGAFRIAGVAPLLIVLTLAALATWRDFYKPVQIDTRSALRSIRATWQPGDLLYVYYTAGQVFSYYAPRLGFTHDQYIQGTCTHATNRTPILEVDMLRGRPRVWVMALGLRKNPFLDFLDANGRVRQVIDISGSDGATSPLSEGFVSLYDLSSRTRPGILANAMDVPEETDPEAMPWTCYGVQNPVPAMARKGVDE